MDASTRPRLAKRRRAEGTHKNQEPEHIPERAQPWYDDGNIVLQAELKQFRIHRSILSANSVIFKDMFSLAQPTVEGDTVDDCPVVHLSDSAVDLQHVLQAFYNRRNYSVHKDTETFPVVAAFLRLGKKYEIKRLYDEAFSRLRNDYPPTLALWEQGQRFGKVIKDYQGVYFDVVNLAREMRIPSLLPAAFYAICVFHGHVPDSIVTGLTHTDICGTSVGNISIMSAEDQIACLIGLQKLYAKQTIESFGWIDHDADSDVAARCYQWSECELARKSLWFDISRSTISRLPLERWNPIFEEDLCDACIEACKAAYAKSRRDIWNELPSIFGLPDWKELEQK